MLHDTVSDQANPFQISSDNYCDDDEYIRITTIRLAILVAFCFLVYKKAAHMFHVFREKMNRSEVVPGFPSVPNPHWLVGHILTLRGIEEKLANEGGEEVDGVSTGFVDGYQRVYCDYADPLTGMGSFWFFHLPCVFFLRGRDVKKVMCSSSYRKSVSIVNKHTKQLLGEKTLLSLMNKEWRHFRNAVHKSFTSENIKQSRHHIYHVGTTLADALLARFPQIDSVSSKETEGENTSDDDSSEDETVTSSNPFVTSTEVGENGAIRVLPVMKMATIDVFGKVALRSNGVDFGCTRNLELSPLASAFDYLTIDYTTRLNRPWDPFSFLYSLPSKANREYYRNRKKIRTFISEQIRQVRTRIGEGGHSEQKEQCDFLTNLINAADSEKVKNGTMKISDKTHDDALGDILMTLLFAGFDTTSICLTYTLYLLAKNPTKKAKCLAEIDAVLGSDREVDDPHDETRAHTLPPGVEELPYTKAVILESLRLYPPAPATIRTITKPTTVGGDRCDGGSCNTNGGNTNISGDSSTMRVLAKGQMVMLPIWSIQRSELNYPRPDEMIPERWVRRRTKRRNDSEETENGTQYGESATSLWEVRSEKDDTRDRETTSSVRTATTTSSSDHANTELWDDDETSIPPANRDAFCAFSAGARNCVGRNLAIEESVILLACLIRKLSFELVSDTYEISPSLHAVVQQPDDDLPMIVRPRQR